MLSFLSLRTESNCLPRSKSIQGPCVIRKDALPKLWLQPGWDRLIWGVKIPVRVIRCKHQAVIHPQLSEKLGELTRSGRFLHRLGCDPDVLSDVFRGKPPQVGGLLPQ